MPDRMEQLPDLSGMRVLLAEDNVTNQIVASEMLKAMGAAVEIACDGMEAMELLARGAFDALVVDIEMPRVSGIDLIRAVRGSEEPLRSRPILALTAYPPESHDDRIVAAGADRVMSKPVDSIAALGRALLSRRMPPAATGAARDAAALSRASLQALRDAVGEDAAARIMARMIADLAETGAEAQTALETGDMPALRRASHVLTGIAGTAGAAQLHALAESLHVAARENRLRDAAAAMSRVRRESARVAAELRDALGGTIYE